MRVLWLTAGLGVASFSAALADVGDPAAPPENSAPSGLAAPANAPSTSDQAWSQIGNDASHLTNAEKVRDLEAMKQAVMQIQADTASFARNFPSDKRSYGARLMQAQADQVAVGLDLPGAPAHEAVLNEFHQLATDPSVPKEVRVEAAVVDGQEMFLSVLSGARENPHDAAMWDALEGKIEAFANNSGDQPGQEPAEAVPYLRDKQMSLLQQAGETARLKALLGQMSKSTQPQMVELAKAAQAKFQQDEELKTKPLDLQFTAVDGTAVDLSKLRGKVVLLDFWATWCPPCRGETPSVVATYRKYHGQGLEIVGVSLDQDKAALQQYTLQNQMPWPQYFDGQGWDNALAKRFGIDSIPAMWLIGKNGVVATQNGRDDLDGQVGKLLGTP